MTFPRSLKFGDYRLAAAPARAPFCLAPRKIRLRPFGRPKTAFRTRTFRGQIRGPSCPRRQHRIVQSATENQLPDNAS
jgi:hypothetical protein